MEFVETDHYASRLPRGYATCAVTPPVSVERMRHIADAAKQLGPDNCTDIPAMPGHLTIVGVAENVALQPGVGDQKFKATGEYKVTWRVVEKELDGDLLAEAADNTNRHPDEFLRASENFELARIDAIRAIASAAKLEPADLDRGRTAKTNVLFDATVVDPFNGKKRSYQTRGGSGTPLRRVVHRGANQEHVISEEWQPVLDEHLSFSMPGKAGDPPTVIEVPAQEVHCCDETTNGTEAVPPTAIGRGDLLGIVVQPPRAYTMNGKAGLVFRLVRIVRYAASTTEANGPLAPTEVKRQEW